MTGHIIELVDLTKKYRSFTAVDHINLTVRKGEIFGLLGPNGAGKSTTILMMLGLTEPTAGSAKVCGIDPTRHPTEVKGKVGYLPEDVGFYDDRNGLDNLIYTAMLNRIPEAQARVKAFELLKRVGLDEEAWTKKTGKYSRGMRQRLGLADVLIKSPEVIILDEPTSGIDPQGVRAFLELIIELRDEQGLTVLFSSHNLHQVQQVCDRVGVFKEGKLLAQGDIATLSEQSFGDREHELEAIYNHYFEGGTQHEAK
jgi:ABC-2 type transport system ATP-binding protein